MTEVTIARYKSMISNRLHAHNDEARRAQVLMASNLLN
ncbi:hypothetical protein M2351_004042 [Azospirillum canadense]|nr:hypothetical protein [Azospirillum canadense]